MVGDSRASKLRIELAPAAVGVTLAGAVFFPEQQRHASPTELAVNGRLVLLRLEPLARLGAVERREQQRLQPLLGQRRWEAISPGSGAGPGRCSRLPRDGVQAAPT